VGNSTVNVEERRRTSLLHIQDLSVRYGVVTAVSGVDLSVQKGQIVSILGPNGAGKSTLLKSIAGVLSPSTGQIWNGDVEIPYGSPEKTLRLGIALVPEGRNIFGPLTVEENLKLGGSTAPRSELSDRLDEAFDRFPILAERRHQAAGTLSGGEQQQLAIARALMSRPDIMLCDEPSLGLAPMIVEQIFGLITSLRSEGITTLLVEQNVHLALGISDYAYILASGRVVLEGQSEKLQSQDLSHLYLGSSE